MDEEISNIDAQSRPRVYGLWIKVGVPLAIFLFLLLVGIVFRKIFFAGGAGNKEYATSLKLDAKFFATSTYPDSAPAQDSGEEKKEISKKDYEKKKIIPPILTIPSIEFSQRVRDKISPPVQTPPTATEERKIVSSIMPPLNEDGIFNAVVKIQCPTKNGLGKYIGSGFVLKGGKVITAAHVVKDSGSETCEVIFPRDRKAIVYLKATIDNWDEVKKRHDQEGIDFAVLQLPLLDTYDEAKAVFQEYPAVPYPLCRDPNMLGDDLLHFGYPANFVDHEYLQELRGKAVVYADITGVKEVLSQDQTYTYKTPLLDFKYDSQNFHPYMISRVGIFFGDSGGLVFDASKQCIVGPHRGGTIGGDTSENYTIFTVLSALGLGQ